MSLIATQDIMCNGHRFVKSSLFQTPGYLADLSPYISAVISSRIFSAPLQLTASAMKPLAPFAQSILPTKATNLILNATLTCEHCLYQVGSDSFDDGRSCPSLLLEQLAMDSGDFVLADQLLEAQDRRRVERVKASESAVSDDKLGEVVCKNRIEDDPFLFKDDLLIIRICPEIGLHAQGFRCIDCDGQIDLESSRLCHYDGRYYCFDCHTGSDLVPIPARVLGSWDFTPKPVSKRSLQKICYLRTKPVLFNLFQFNSMLYGFIERLVELKQVRERIQSMLKYLEVCGQSERPNLMVVPKHFLNIDLLNFFTLNDLFDINQVYDMLNQLQTNLESHIVKKCESCRGKGFYCELCKDPTDILYPFSNNSASCNKCHTVYHKNCFQRKKRNCSRCVRISLKKKSESNLECTSSNEDLSSTSA